MTTSDLNCWGRGAPHALLQLQRPPGNTGIIQFGRRNVSVHSEDRAAERQTRPAAQEQRSLKPVSDNRTDRRNRMAVTQAPSTAIEHCTSFPCQNQEGPRVVFIGDARSSPAIGRGRCVHAHGLVRGKDRGYRDGSRVLLRQPSRKRTKYGVFRQPGRHSWSAPTYSARPCVGGPGENMLNSPRVPRAPGAHPVLSPFHPRCLRSLIPPSQSDAVARTVALSSARSTLGTRDKPWANA